jgi:molybdenum-dependent DNA-binding transcriptional regulator ModE
VAEGRRIPVRLTPLPGESLDGWLLSSAYTLDATPSEILTQAGVFGRQKLESPRSLCLGLSTEALSALGSVAGLDRGVLTDLAQPVRRVDAVAREAGSRQLSQLTGVMSWSRYCPHCLSDTDGRWQGSWRLAWNTTCPKHGVLLLSHCPSCRSRQRERRVRNFRSPVHPARCTGRDALTADPSRLACEADLRSGDPVSATERLIEVDRFLIETANASATAEGAVRLSEVLRDYGVLALAEARRTGTPLTWSLLEQTEPLARILTSAAAALHDSAAPEFIALAGVDGVAEHPRALPAGWAHASPRLVAQAIERRHTSLRPSDQIRWTSFTEGSRPSGDLARAQLMTERLPAALWPEWTLRLLDTQQAPTPTLFRGVAVIALLLANSRLAIASLCRAFPEAQVREGNVYECFAGVSKTDRAELALATLSELARGIADTAPPIDYARRRSLARSANLLSRDAWKEYCGGARVSPGDARRLLLARLWLWEELTGGTFRQAPPNLTLDTPEFGAAYFDFCRSMPPLLIDALRSHCEKFLKSHRIKDEPVTWSPPAPAIGAGLWPGFDASSIEASELRGSLASGECLTSIGSRLGISSEHMRVLIRSGEFATERVPLVRVRKYIPETELRRTLQGPGATVDTAAAPFGASRGTIIARAHHFAIPLLAGTPRKWSMEPEWLRIQYVERWRSMRDIAEEVGCSLSTVKTRLREGGVPTRAVGGASQQTASPAREPLPPLLDATTRGPDGIERVRRFAVIAAAPSVAAAAREIGVSNASLLMQLSKLEQKAGGCVIERNRTSRCPHALTPLGVQLLDQAKTYLGIESPEGHFPEPLLSATRVFRGEKRISRFLQVVDAGSVTASAALLHTDPSSIVKSIKSLELNLRRRLVIDTSRRSSLRLTPDGSRLVEQAHLALGGGRFVGPPEQLVTRLV